MFDSVCDIIEIVKNSRRAREARKGQFSPRKFDLSLKLNKARHGKTNLISYDSNLHFPGNTRCNHIERRYYFSRTALDFSLSMELKRTASSSSL